MGPKCKVWSNIAMLVYKYAKDKCKARGSRSIVMTKPDHYLQIEQKPTVEASRTQQQTVRCSVMFSNFFLLRDYDRPMPSQQVYSERNMGTSGGSWV